VIEIGDGVFFVMEGSKGAVRFSRPGGKYLYTIAQHFSTL
jgi:hypothetical protein